MPAGYAAEGIEVLLAVAIPEVTSVAVGEIYRQGLISMNEMV
jgi:hypothetical protein